MKRQKQIIWVLVLLSAILWFFASAFVVPEGESALLIHKGVFVRDAQTGKALLLQPGLHFKVPFFNAVQAIDLRGQVFTVTAHRIDTLHGQPLLFDYSLHWHVIEPENYLFKFKGLPSMVEDALQQIVDGLLDATYSKLTLSEIMLGKDGNFADKVVARLNQRFQNFGIVIDDFSITEIDLTPQANAAIIATMSIPLKNFAVDKLATVERQAAKIRNGADRAAEQLLAEAKLRAAQILAAGQKEAILIYKKQE